MLPSFADGRAPSASPAFIGRAAPDTAAPGQIPFRSGPPSPSTTVLGERRRKLGEELRISASNARRLALEIIGEVASSFGLGVRLDAVLGTRVPRPGSTGVVFRLGLACPH